MEQCVAECKNHNSDSNTLSYIFFLGTAYYVSVCGRGGGGGLKEGVSYEFPCG